MQYKIEKARCRLADGTIKIIKFSEKADLCNTCGDIAQFRKDLKAKLEKMGFEIEYILLMYETRDGRQ